MPALVPCNQSLHATFDLLQEGAAFANVLDIGINNIKTAGFSKQTDITAAIASLNPLSGTYAADLTSLTNLKLKLIELAGSDGTTFNTSPLGRYLIWTNFSSGVSSSFPYSQLGPIINTIPGYTILAGASFLTALSITAGAKQVDSELCEYDPEDPCAAIGGVFGSVLGTFNTSLTAILNFINGLTNFLANSASYITQIQAYIDLVIAKIIAEVTALVSMILRGLNYGLAKLLTGIGLDPCLYNLVNAIGTNQLRTALGIV